MKRGENKCSCCGKFKAWRNLYMQTDDNEYCAAVWFECWDCLSDFDRQRYANAAALTEKYNREKTT